MRILNNTTGEEFKVTFAWSFKSLLNENHNTREQNK